MFTSSTNPPARRRARGLSLIEILVGLVIGMIGIVVIFQVLAVSESRKRTTVTGGDAQSAGAIGLYSLQRDVQLAGYGFGGAETVQLGCTVNAYDALRTGAAGYPKDFSFPLVPVQITQGAAGAPDRIAVLWGSSSQFVTTRSWKPAGTVKAMTGGRGGLDYEDLLVVTSNPATAALKTECALVQVTDRPGTGSDIGHDVDYDATPPAPKAVRFNKAATWPTGVFGAAEGFVLNLGKQPRRTVWAVCNAAEIADNTSPCFGRPEFVNRLVTGETLFGNVTTAPVGPAPVVSEAADGIVDLQAEYGIDRNNNQIIDANEWTVTPPSDAALPSDPLNPCSVDNPVRSWRCVRAIRVALLARSAQFDKGWCYARPQWTSGAGGALALTDFTMVNLDGAAGGAPIAVGTACPAPDPNDWRFYRYTVYETVIPLRNMIWGTAP